jgi:aquaporin NIP
MSAKTARAGLGRRAIAEGLGTFGLVFAGCGALMVAERFPGSVAPGAVPMVFGLVIAAMIYALGHLSGAHFNPAVTLGFASVGRFPKREVPAYWAAQVLGAVLAVGSLWLLLPPGQTFGATLPQVPAWQALGWEVILTFWLMLVIISVATDQRASGAMAGLAIGMTVALDAFAGGPITGASMNPARSLAPALFQGHFQVLWIYFAGPAIGAVAAAFTYEFIRQ